MSVHGNNAVARFEAGLSRSRTVHDRTEYRPVHVQRTFYADQKHYQHLQENLKANPDGFKENVDLANFLFDNQRYEDALIYYVRALRTDPNQPDVLVDAGVCYFNQKKLDEARGYFERALKIDNRHLNALYNMGIVSAQQGNMSQMIEYWERLIEIAPESAQAKSAKQMLDGVRAVKP
jgi:Tfp pilus assembly protein PilF